MAPPSPAAGAIAEAPLIRIVRGAPRDDELAAVVAVLTAVLAAPTPAPRPPRPATHRWRAPARPGWAGPRSWTSARTHSPTTHSRSTP